MNRASYDLFCESVKKARELHTVPIYAAGDDTYVMTLGQAAPRDFEAVSERLYAKAAKAARSYAVGENRFVWVEADDGYEGAYEIPSMREIRLIRRFGACLLPERLTEEHCFGKEKTLIQLCPDDDAGNFGMGYLVCLGDGHFVMYDGNGDLGGMADKLYGYLERYTPCGKTPVIDAWLITHFHWDHVTGLYDFSKKYNTRVRLRNFLVNFPELEAVDLRERGPNTEFYARWWPKIREKFKEAAVWKLHTGLSTTIGDVRIEVLLTHEDHGFGGLRANDTSVVTTLSVNGKKLFFPGDLENQKPCALLHNMYGGYLKSDVYQAAHHGWGTEALCFYDDVDAPVVLWPLRLRDWDTIQQFPATRRMTAEMEAGKRRFLLSRREDIHLSF